MLVRFALGVALGTAAAMVVAASLERPIQQKQLEWGTQNP
jgi:predicted small secreted protein